MSGIREQSITSLPQSNANPQATEPPNPAQDVLMFVGDVTSVVTAPVDMLNQGVASLTNGISNVLPSFPAARTLVDLVFGWPHSHPHPPSFGTPLPSIGPVLLAGSLNVLINGLPAARCGDIGFGAWCGGYFPMFEVFTGSSNVFIGGARASRMLIDFTRHCSLPFQGKNLGKGLGAMDKVMMGVLGGMGALGVAAQATDSMNQAEEAENADSAEVAAAASAASSAAALGAAMTAAQTAADMAALALSVGMGKDPGLPPLACFGNFITGSMNVLIGGLPIPGWTLALAGLGKLLRKGIRRIQLKLPKGNRLKNALCRVTGHPVDIASGRVFTSQKDFELPGQISIEFTRYWDSSSTEYNGVLGYGWMHPYEIHLWRDDDQEVLILRNEEGRILGFDSVVIGEKAFNPLEKIWIERISENEYVIRKDDGLLYRFGCIDSESGRSERTALKLLDIEDRSGNILTLTYKDGYLSKLIDKTGVRVEFEYSDLNNGIIRLTNIMRVLPGGSKAEQNTRLMNFSYDVEGQLVKAIDRTDVFTSYEYKDRLLVRETNRNKLDFFFRYIGKGSEARCVHTWGGGGIYERRLEYDIKSRSTIVEDSLGNITKYYFNEFWLPITIVNASGGQIHYKYGLEPWLLSEVIDELGRVTKYEYNLYGDCTLVQHPDGSSYQVSYDDDRLPCVLVDELGNKYIREYDEKGRMVATIDALGNRMEYVHDPDGKFLEIINPLDHIEKYIFNEYSQVSDYISTEKYVTKYGYDGFQNIANIVDAAGNSTLFVNDLFGRQKTVIQSSGAVFEYEYDYENNLIDYKQSNGSEFRFSYTGFNKLGECWNTLGNTQRYIYNTEGNIIELRNAKNESYRFEYDELNRLKREIEFDGSITSYNYDAAGQVISCTDSANRTTEFVYNLRGSLIEKHLSDGTIIKFDYDQLERLIISESPEFKQTYEYDACGQILKETQNNFVIEYEYDALGRRTKRYSSLGNAVNFSYAAGDYPAQLSVPGGVIEVEYDFDGKPVSRKLPNNTKENFVYDNNRRLIEQSLSSLQNTFLQKTYRYSPEGNPIEIRDNTKGVSHIIFDLLEQIQEVRKSDGKSESFLYDSIGNLIKRGNRVYHLDSSGRPVKYEDVTLKYDNVGNIINVQDSEHCLQYTFNAENRLSSVDSNVSGITEFIYDAFGRRIAERNANQKIEFLWDGDVPLGEVHSDGTDRVREYIFGIDDFKPICRFGSDGFYSFYNDQIGTPTELIDSKGNIAWSASLDVYGNVDKEFIKLTDQKIRFQGQYDYGSLGIYYNYHRFYMPEIGKYISKDPIGLRGGTNFYSYAVNPVKYVDPYGLTTFDPQQNRWVDSAGNPKQTPRVPSALENNGRLDYGDVQQWANQKGLVNQWGPSSQFPTGGFKYEVTVGRFKYTIHGHGINPNAVQNFPGSNSATGPTASIVRRPVQGPNSLKRNFMTTGRWRTFNSDPNAAHIPLDQSPY